MKSVFYKLGRAAAKSAMNPALQDALIGAGVGGAGGLASMAMVPEEDRTFGRYLGHTLGGAALGGAAGGAYGAGMMSGPKAPAPPAPAPPAAKPPSSIFDPGYTVPVPPKMSPDQQAILAGLKDPRIGTNPQLNPTMNPEDAKWMAASDAAERDPVSGLIGGGSYLAGRGLGQLSNLGASFGR